jgi:nitroreductase
VEFEHVVRGRRSTRAFLSDPVPRVLVREVLDAARWAPSWGNSQAWNVTVLSGEALRALTAAISAKMGTGAPSDTDIPFPGEWPEEIKRRMNIRRPAPEGAPAPASAGPSVWEAWGAPTLLLFSVDERLAAEYACFDAGLLVQSVCLAAYDKGLGTCIEAMMVRYAGALHDLLPGTAHLRFVVGVALGYLDETSPVNSFPCERIALDEFVTWEDEL